MSEAIGSPLGPCISRHFNNRKAGCLDATIKIGIDVTVFRFWVFEDRYHAVVIEGKTIKPKRHLLGNNGLVQLPAGAPDLVADFDRWLRSGFPHHVCVVEGRYAERIKVFAEQCGVKIMS